MDVKDVTSSIRQSPSVLFNQLRNRFSESFPLPFSNVDEDVVSNLTGIYQQALKDNGFDKGIRAEGTLQVLGYRQDIAFAWEPGILLSPDLVQWLRSQSDEVRNQINTLIALVVVFYRETLNQIKRTIQEQLERLRDRFVPQALKSSTDGRLDRLRRRLEKFQADPVNGIRSLFAST